MTPVQCSFLWASGPAKINLIAEAGSDVPGGFDPGMVGLNEFTLSGDSFERHRLGAVAARGHHHAKNSFID